MKSFVCVAVLLVCAVAAIEARPKRSIIVTAPVVQAAVPVATVRQATVVHSAPTTVTKTEQVHSGDHSSYSYSQEVKSHPVVHTHAAVAAAPVVAAAVPASTVHTVSTVNHAVPAYTYTYAHPVASYYHPYAYSPYHYVVGK